MSEQMLPVWQVLDPTYEIDRTLADNQLAEFKEPRGNLSPFTKYIVNNENQNDWFVLGSSELHVAFKVMNNNAELTTGQGVVLQNGFALFDRMELRFNGLEVEAVQDPGTVHTMRHLIEYGDDYNPKAEKQIWYPITKRDGLYSIPDDGVDFEDNYVLPHLSALHSPPGGLTGIGPEEYPDYRAYVNFNDNTFPDPIAGIFVIFNNGGDTTGAGKYNIGVVEAGDIAYYTGVAWVRVSRATQALPKDNAVLGSGWHVFMPQNDHSAPIVHSYLPIQDIESEGEEDISEFRGDVKANSQYVATFDAAVARLVRKDVKIGNETFCSCILPLKEVFGSLATAGAKATRGTTMTLVLYKNKDPLTILYAKGPSPVVENAFNIDIKQISLFVRRVNPNNGLQLQVNQKMLQMTTPVRNDYNHYQLYRFSDLALTQTSNHLKLNIDSNRVRWCLVLFQLASKREKIQQNPYQVSAAHDVKVSFIQVKNHDMTFPPSSPFNIGNGDFGRAYNDLAELFVRDRGGMDSFNGGLQITFDQFKDVHTLFPFNMRDTDPALTERFRSSDLEIHYNLSEQPIGAYDVVVITSNTETLLAKRIGDQIKLFA